jgi:nucleoside-diphosphate-sugar epimerase
VLPVLGDGQYRLQPVHISEVAAAFAQALELELAEGEARAYCPAGEEAVTFDEALDRIARGAGLRAKPKAHLPMPLAKTLVNTAGAVGLLPISPAQFQMLVEGNTCDDPAFRADFDLQAVPFTPEHLAYLRGA